MSLQRTTATKVLKSLLTPVIHTHQSKKESSSVVVTSPAASLAGPASSLLGFHLTGPLLPQPTSPSNSAYREDQAVLLLHWNALRKSWGPQSNSAGLVCTLLIAPTSGSLPSDCASHVPSVVSHCTSVLETSPGQHGSLWSGQNNSSTRKGVSLLSSRTCSYVGDKIREN